MPIKRLVVNQLRNLQGVDLKPAPELNFIFGDNGSGKTSLLEAISVLAHGRSFRTTKFRRLIQDEASDFSVFAQLDSTDRSTTLGVLRGQTGEAIYKLDGVAVYSSGVLAARLPTQIMNAGSFNLLEGSAKVRRQLFDWLVFHVKQEFGGLWKDYSRCVKHRNSLLRRDKIARSEIRPWNVEMARLGDLIHVARVECLAPYINKVNELICEGELPETLQIALNYFAGWNTDFTLFEQLENAFDKDVRYGYSTVGAHKSELKISAQKSPAHEILSRGQQKTLIAALYMAELQVYQSFNDTPCVLLVDDLPAELDKKHIRMLGEWINNLKIQVFITGIELEGIMASWPAHHKQIKVFHVKHGHINEYAPDGETYGRRT